MWPSKKTVFNNTVVVLVTLVVSGICVWGLDTLFATLLRLALNMSSAG
ncbi:MAG: preprotein translocase subunit SecE [[Eubacterium] siraeum]